MPRRDECASTRDLDAREDASARAVVRGGKRREKKYEDARARARVVGRATVRERGVWNEGGRDRGDGASDWCGGFLDD
jgi:hypothetical protein|tara:strand:+ start:111 stop:344 length:234 start_codon:yes stop_codon:yes gene_type:complete